MRRRHRGSSLFWDVEIAGTIATNGDLRNTGFVSGSSGWIIRDDGTFELNEGVFRGSIEAATIHIGGDDATSFHVDIDGNMWMGAGNSDFATAPFRVSSDGGLLATDAELRTAGSGSRIVIGGSGDEDKISFYDGTATQRGYLQVNDYSIDIAIPSDDVLPREILRLFGGGSEGSIFLTPTQPRFFSSDESGNAMSIENESTSGLGVGTRLQFFTTSPGPVETNWTIIAGQWTQDSVSRFRIMDMDVSETVPLWYLTSAGIVNASGFDVGAMALGAVGGTFSTGYQGLSHTSVSGGEDAILASNGNTTILNANTSLAFYTAPAVGAQLTVTSTATTVDKDLYVGDELSLRDWPGGSTYQGLMHSGLANDYMIMSNSTDTYVGADGAVYFRPGGNVTTYQWEMSTAGKILAPGASALTYAFSADTDTGFGRVGANIAGAYAGGSLIMQWGSGGVFAPGMRTTTAGGLVVERFPSSGNELYGETSSGRFKKNQRPANDMVAKLLAVEPKMWDAMAVNADGTVVDLAPAEGRREKDRGTLYDRPGLILEEVELVWPEVVIFDDAGDPVGLDRMQLITALIQVVQDLDRRIPGGRP